MKNYHIINAEGVVIGTTDNPGFNPGAGLRVIEAPAEPEKDLQRARLAKLTEAARAAQAFIEQAAGLNTVPQFERDSWATQALEAQAWAADNNAPTPVLAGIARARGVHVDILRQKALAKTRAFAALTASVAGQRQAYEDAITAADSLEALERIAILYKMPMMPMTPAQGGDA